MLGSHSYSDISGIPLPFSRVDWGELFSRSDRLGSILSRISTCLDTAMKLELLLGQSDAMFHSTGHRG